VCVGCRGLGKAAEAEPLCRRALHIREQAYGAESPNVATALTALADVLKEMSRYRQAATGTATDDTCT
jgi:hypothetical protein